MGEYTVMSVMADSLILVFTYASILWLDFIIFYEIRLIEDVGLFLIEIVIVVTCILEFAYSF